MRVSQISRRRASWLDDTESQKETPPGCKSDVQPYVKLTLTIDAFARSIRQVRALLRPEPRGTYRGKARPLGMKRRGARYGLVNIRGVGARAAAMILEHQKKSGATRRRVLKTED